MTNGGKYLLNSVSLESYIFWSVFYYSGIKVTFRPKERRELVTFSALFTGVGTALGEQFLPPQLSHSISDKNVLRT